MQDIKVSRILLLLYNFYWVETLVSIKSLCLLIAHLYQITFILYLRRWTKQIDWVVKGVIHWLRTVITLHHYNDNTTHFRSIQRIVMRSICVYAYAKLKQQSCFENKHQIFLAHIAHAVNMQTYQFVNWNGKSAWNEKWMNMNQYFWNIDIIWLHKYN